MLQYFPETVVLWIIKILCVIVRGALTTQLKQNAPNVSVNHIPASALLGFLTWDVDE